MRSYLGFTYIEMMVVVAIIGILATFAVLALLPYRGDVALVIARENLQDMLRDAKARVLAGTEVDGEIPYGYGVEITVGSDEIVLFADIDNDKKYTPTGGKDKEVRRIFWSQTSVSSTEGEVSLYALFHNSCDAPSYKANVGHGFSPKTCALTFYFASPYATPFYFMDSTELSSGSVESAEIMIQYQNTDDRDFFAVSDALQVKHAP